MDVCYCHHPKVGFYYFCSEHKPNKPASELREVLLVDMLGKSNCAECGVLLKPVQTAKENTMDIDDTSNVTTLKTPEQDARIGKRAICGDFIGIIESVIVSPLGETIQLKNATGGGKGGCSPETVTILEDVQPDIPPFPSIAFAEYGDEQQA